MKQLFTSKPDRAAFYHLTTVEEAPVVSPTGGNPRKPCFVVLTGTDGVQSRVCALWSTNSKDGFAAPPAIGERVQVTFNQLGAGEVVGYFVEAGFLGIEVKPDKRPDWHVKQGSKEHYLVFGAEVRREVAS